MAGLYSAFPGRLTVHSMADRTSHVGQAWRKRAEAAERRVENLKDGLEQAKKALSWRECDLIIRATLKEDENG